MSTMIENGTKIGVDALKLADIICSTGNAKISKAIRAATGSIVSHSMLFSGGGKVIESVGGGVREVPLSEALDGAQLAIAFRPASLPESSAHVVVDFARQQATDGKKYDIRGIIAQAGYQLDRIFFSEEQAARANLWIQDENRYFCSELIAAAFQHAGFPLTNTRPAAVSPQTLVELGSTDTLAYVGHLLGL
ncbi:MAG: hypothetical protein KDK70_00355 [Myxococcales bacterium]|nr:hypothetical protein [Myxococcales bacterium]